MALTKVEIIRDTMRQGYEPEHYESLYRQMCYAFGESWNDAATGLTWGEEGKLLSFPDVKVRYLESGQSRRILNAAVISLSRVMYAQPAPEFPQVDKITGEIRKQFVLKRADGDGTVLGDWHTEDMAAYFDADGLGFGCCQIVLETNPITGRQRAGIRHVPAIHVLWDRHERNPDRARWCAFVHHIRVEDAVSRYGERARNWTRTTYEGQKADLLETVRIVEYYDIGLGRSEPTRTVLASELEGEVIERGRNPFPFLPMAHMMNYTPSGMARPTGRIMMQMATQRALNKQERYTDWVLEQGPIDIFDPSSFDDQDVEAILRGEYPHRRLKTSAKMNKDNALPFVRIPGADIQPGMALLMQNLERLHNAESGTNDLDRGSRSNSQTLGQDMLLAQRSDTQGLWMRQQAAKYHRRKVEKFLEVARLFDRDPVVLDIQGRDIPINVPGVPQSFIDQFLDEPSRVVISEDALEFRDMRLERMQRSRELDSLAPLVQGGMVDPQWWATEKLKALGYDPAEAMPSLQAGGTDPSGMLAQAAQALLQGGQPAAAPTP